MNIDFREFENRLKTFVKEKYPTYLREGLPAPDDYIDDFIDLDQYKKSNQVFFEFDNYNFSGLSNESEDQKINLNIFIACRNDTSKNLKIKMLDYTTDFYKFFEGTGNNFSGIIDYGKIETVNFFDAVEGDTGLKLAQLSISMNAEI